MLWSLCGDLRKFRPVQFCAKLAIVRCIVDSLFWLGHRLIHERGFYKYIHKFHHEHRNPRTLLTNQHFTIIDFFVEALVPLVTAIQSLRAMSISTLTLGGGTSWCLYCVARSSFSLWKASSLFVSCRTSRTTVQSRVG